MKYIIMLLLLCVVSCAPRTGPKGDPGPTGPAAPVPEFDENEEIEVVLQEENEYRAGLGQSILAPGLSCTLQTFTSGDRIQATIPGHTTLTGLVTTATFLYTETFNQPDSPGTDGMNVIPAVLRPSYTNLFKLTCSGFIVVTETNYQGFSLASDDASVLTVASVKVIDNDNNHGITTVIGSKHLRRGVHAFKLEYAQAGAGNQALILLMNNAAINPATFFH